MKDKDLTRGERFAEESLKGLLIGRSFFFFSFLSDSLEPRILLEPKVEDLLKGAHGYRGAHKIYTEIPKST